MRRFAIASFSLAGALMVAACSETTSQSPAMRTGSATDEQACELAVTRQTNNPDVVTLSSQFSQANTEVIIGVGAERAKWRCLVSGGRVAEVMSLTNEGAL